MVERMLTLGEDVEAFEQILQPQQSPDAFVQRIFVKDQSDGSQSVSHINVALAF